MTSHSKIVRKFHAYPDRVLKKSASIIDELDIPRDLGIGLIFSRNESLLLAACTHSSFHWLLLIHMEARSTSTTLVQKWHVNTDSSTSTMSRLKWFVLGDSLIRPGHALYLQLLFTRDECFQAVKNLWGHCYFSSFLLVILF